jgi:hypothetical protein
MLAFSASFGGLMKRTTVVSGGIRQLIPKVRSWWWDEDESGLKEQRMPKFDEMTDKSKSKSKIRVKVQEAGKQETNVIFKIEYKRLREERKNTHVLPQPYIQDFGPQRDQRHLS